jgi:hypothetical protein
MPRLDTSAAVARIERAQAVTQTGLVHEFLDQADALLDRAVGAHRAGSLTDRDAAVAIATISELRMAANKANRAVLQGTEAGESLSRTTA